MKQIGFKLSELDDEILLLLGQILFLGFKFGFLDANDHSKQLVLETTLSDNEINDCALSCSFWTVVRIDQLSLQVELE